MSDSFSRDVRCEISHEEWYNKPFALQFYDKQTNKPPDTNSKLKHLEEPDELRHEPLHLTDPSQVLHPCDTALIGTLRI